MNVQIGEAAATGVLMASGGRIGVSRRLRVEDPALAREVYDALEKAAVKLGVTPAMALVTGGVAVTIGWDLTLGETLPVDGDVRLVTARDTLDRLVRIGVGLALVLRTMREQEARA